MGEFLLLLMSHMAIGWLCFKMGDDVGYDRGWMDHYDSVHKRSNS